MIIMKNMTLDEAKKEVIRLIEQGVNYREVAQIKFVINDRIKKFSIGEISKLKKESSEKVDVQHKDHDLALLFKLFTKGRTPTQVVMETGTALDFVERAYTKFLEWENRVTVPQWFEDYMYELAEHFDEAPNLTQAYHNLKEMVDIYDVIKKLPAYCSICREPLDFSEAKWKEAAYYLSNRWHHVDCA